MRAALAAAALVLLTAAASGGDLRGLSVGVPASDMPADGFTDFACAGAPEHGLDGWGGWASCPADAAGLHGVRFAFAQGDTKVAGHPVQLTALFDAAGRFTTLRIETDPKIPLFLRKKAFLFGLQARAHWGDEDWTCTQGAPDDQKQPLGGVFVDEMCRKHVPGRDVAVQRRLFQPPGSDPKAFVGDTVMTVTAAP